MVTAVSAIANGGVLMKPFVVSEIRNAKGQLVAQTMPQAKRRVISADTARTLTTLMEGVVTNGTGGKAAIPGFRVAGKTGTAQKVDPRTGAYSSTLLVGSFELAHHPEIPYRVVINEAVELAKTFGGTDGFKYVNAGRVVSRVCAGGRSATGDDRRDRRAAR